MKRVQNYELYRARTYTCPYVHKNARILQDDTDIQACIIIVVIQHISYYMFMTSYLFIFIN
jgi:hypothetical protein